MAVERADPGHSADRPGHSAGTGLSPSGNPHTSEPDRPEPSAPPLARRGRHRRGAPVTATRPGRWDSTHRDSARRLDQAEPAWTVWYGVGTRRFYAIAAWPAPEPLIVHARTPDELRRLMRGTERAAHPHLAPEIFSVPGPSGSDSSASDVTPASVSADHVPPYAALTPASRALPYGAPVPADRSVPPPSSQGGTMPGTPDGPRTAQWTLPHDLSVVRKTRGLVEETLTAWGFSRLADDVLLAAGELLANAISYGEPLVRLTLRAEDGALWVEATDRGPELPRRLNLGLDAVHGRGLTIVEALSDAFGVTPLPDTPGKTVWARWTLSR